MSKADTLKEGNRPHQIRATPEIFNMLKGKGQDASAGLEAFIGEMAKTTTRCHEAEVQVSNLQSRLNESENRITLFEENAVETRKKITGLETEKVELEQKEKALNIKINEANQTVAKQVYLIEVTETERDDYKKEKIDNIKALENYKAEISVERRLRATKIAELESSVSTKTTEINQLAIKAKRAKTTSIFLAIGLIFSFALAHLLVTDDPYTSYRCRPRQDQGPTTRYTLT